MPSGAEKGGRESNARIFHLVILIPDASTPFSALGERHEPAFHLELLWLFLACILLSRGPGMNLEAYNLFF